MVFVLITVTMVSCFSLVKLLNEVNALPVVIKLERNGEWCLYTDTGSSLPVSFIPTR